MEDRLVAEGKQVSALRYLKKSQTLGTTRGQGVGSNKKSC
jgi:hypothetical protein